MINVTPLGNVVKGRAGVLSQSELRALAAELSAALPPAEVLAAEEQELINLYRLLDKARQDATRSYLSAMV